MPFINTRVSVTLSEEKEQAIKSKLGQAIALIPGKSESWLMTNFEDQCHLYFRGDNSEPIAYVEVRVLGQENPSAFDALTGEICKILKEELGIAPDHIYVEYRATTMWGWNGSNL